MLPQSRVDSEIVERSVDQRVYLRDVAWEDFERLLAIKGDDPVPRMAYLEGTVELMTPSEDHEAIKKTIARLLEAYAEELGIELEGIGSWTLKRAEQKRGIEPDECYSIGRVRGTMPDLALDRRRHRQAGHLPRLGRTRSLDVGRRSDRRVRAAR
jgi:Uma2 family endonuclease